MTPRQPSRLALAVFDRCVPANDALRGDLIEEFEAGRPQWWLWWQVIGAVFYQRPLDERPKMVRAELLLVATGLIVLISFEAVFIANVVYRVAFGPPMQNITGYAYLFHLTASGRSTGGLTFPLAFLYTPLTGLAVAIPFGWFVGRFHRQHQQMSIAVFAIGTHLWAVVNLRAPFPVQFLSMLLLVVGTLVTGRLAVAATDSREFSRDSRRGF